MVIWEEAHLVPELLLHTSTKLNTATAECDFLYCVFNTTISAF